MKKLRDKNLEKCVEKFKPKFWNLVDVSLVVIFYVVGFVSFIALIVSLVMLFLGISEI